MKQLEVGKRTAEALNLLLVYMKAFWLNTIGADRFSVYMEPHRTNNNVESWHRSLNRKLIGKRLEMWKFIGKQLASHDY